MGVARLYKVGSPYNADDLTEIDFEQTADVMYMAHWDHIPTKLQRFGHTDWRFVPVTFGPLQVSPTAVAVAATVSTSTAGSYFPFPSSYAVTAINDNTGQESRALAPIAVSNDLGLKGNRNTITWAAAPGATRYVVYKSENGASLGYIGTTDVLSFVDNAIAADQSDGPPLGQNPFDGVGNFPSTVTFFEQRLVWARTKLRPNGVWGSRSANYENMDTSRPLKADDSVTFGIVAGRVNAVNQLVALTDLLALTSDSLFKINGGGQGGYLTPTNVVSRRQVGFGSSRLGPLVIGNTVFFKPSTGSSVRTLGYTFQIDGYESNNVTVFSPHFFSGFDIVSWAFAQEPLSCIWAARSDGALLCFTWEHEQQVFGWTLCETDGFVESVCVITEQGEDRVYLVVQRTVKGVAKRYVERMASARFTTVESSCYLDCAVTFTAATLAHVFGPMYHLEGCTVTALADGNVFSGLVVTNGKVTLPVAAKVVTVGLPYEAIVETLPLSVALQGTSIAKRQSIAQAVLKLKDARGLSCGSKDDNMYDIKPRLDEDWGEPNDLLNGDYEVDVPADWSSGATLIIKQSHPLPFTLTAILLDPLFTS